MSLAGIGVLRTTSQQSFNGPARRPPIPVRQAADRCPPSGVASYVRQSLVTPTLASLRPAYSLLELMIALGLLAALLTAAWSILNTYQNAERRGRELVQRIEVVRASRVWLQQDLMRILPQNTVLVADQKSPSPAMFRGDEFGFSATVLLQPHPIDLLKQIVDQDDLESSATDIGVASQPEWPPQSNSARRTFGDGGRMATAQVEYRLELDESQAGLGTPSRSSMLDQPASEKWIMVRREYRPLNVASNAASQLADNSQRELSAADLYRQTVDAEPWNGMEDNSVRLPGLSSPRFLYCDGSAWRSNWNSQSNRRLPTAVALVFNLPTAEHSSKYPSIGGARDFATDRVGVVGQTQFESPQPLVQQSFSKSTLNSASADGEQGTLLRDPANPADVYVVVCVGNKSEGSMSSSTDTGETSPDALVGTSP
ncbi:MAG: hypothetical protein KF752_13960 [Pirellulaceae bacterium]|nr:hypothetical protein [Pirellulaceae bacterium]